MINFKTTQYFNALFLPLFVVIVMTLSACSTTEDEPFESAFDTPITSSMQGAMDSANENNAARTGRMLTRDDGAAVTAARVSSVQISPIQTARTASSLMVTTNPVSLDGSADNTRIYAAQNQSPQEQTQLDWSKVKRWSGGASDNDVARAPKLRNPLISPKSPNAPRITKPVIEDIPIEPMPYTSSAGKSDTTLAAGDTINLIVYGEDDLSGEYLLDNRGAITVPLIGEVRAAGLSKIELQNVIAEALITEEFLEKPYVTVSATRLQPFYILGEVRTPGQYDYEPTLDVFKAIAMAGGYTPRAAKSKIIITRIHEGRKTRFYAVEDTDLLPGDSILVKQRFF